MYDNAAGVIFRLEKSPRMISQFGLFTSYQANVDAQGNNIVGDAANEPSIAVDPTNSNKMTIGWRQFDTLSSNFRQGGWGYTTDGGDSLDVSRRFANQAFSAAILFWTRTRLGTFFYLSLRGDDIL